MSVSLTLSPVSYSLYALGGLGTTSPSSRSISSITTARLADGRIGVEWLDDLQSGTDTLYFGVFNPADGTFSASAAPAAALITAVPISVSAGPGNSALLLLQNNSSALPVTAARLSVQRVNPDGTSVGGPIAIGQPALEGVEPLRNGGFAILTSDGLTPTQTSLSDLRIIRADGSAGPVILGAAPRVTPGALAPTVPSIAELADGAIVVAWTMGGTSGSGINFRIWNADGSPRTDVVSVYTGAASSTFNNVWRAGDVEVGATPDGGFFIGRSVDFQKFDGNGAVASLRGLKGGTAVDDIEVLPDGNMFFHSEGTINGKANAVFQLTPTGGDLALREVATLTTRPGGVTGGRAPKDAVQQLDDGSLLVFSSVSSALENGVHTGATILVQRLIYQGNPQTPTDGNDTLFGSGGPDLLAGRGGSDRLTGNAGNDVLIGDGPLSLSASAQQIKRLYIATLDRAPDDGGWANWTTQRDAGQSLEAIAAGFVGSTEFQAKYGALDNTGFVTQLYRNVLDREPDAAGLANAVNALNSGALSRTQIVTGFSESAEFIAGTSTSLHAGQVYRLYGATLGRAPDAGGFETWTDGLGGGRSLVDIAAGFVNSSEFQQRYGSLDNAGFVTLLYQNVLGRAPDAGGLAFWQGQLDTSAQSRTQVVTGFSESAEYIVGTRPGVDAFMRTVMTAWSDTLNGGSGDDWLTGGRGSDRYVFSASEPGNDNVYGFDSYDTLQLTGFGFANSAAALAAVSQLGANAVLAYNGGSITFVDTQVSVLQGLSAQGWVLG